MYTCNNSSVSFYEQQQIRENIRREQELQDQFLRSQEPYTPTPLSGANTVPIASRLILPGPRQHESVPEPTPPVSCVRSCSMVRTDLGKACEVLARIPAVRTIFEKCTCRKESQSR